MSNIIQFGTSSVDVIEKKHKRFKELKVKNFSGTITEPEEIEMDDLSKWLKIHN
jgi:hypothetical protein